MRATAGVEAAHKNKAITALALPQQIETLFHCCSPSGPDIRATEQSRPLYKMSDQGDRVVWRPLSHAECKHALYIHLHVRNNLCATFPSPLVISTSRLLLAEPSGGSPILILYLIHQFNKDKIVLVQAMKAYGCVKV